MRKLVVENACMKMDTKRCGTGNESCSIIKCSPCCSTLKGISCHGLGNWSGCLLGYFPLKVFCNRPTRRRLWQKTQNLLEELFVLPGLKCNTSDALAFAVLFLFYLFFWVTIGRWGNGILFPGTLAVILMLSIKFILRRVVLVGDTKILSLSFMENQL